MCSIDLKGDLQTVDLHSIYPLTPFPEVKKVCDWSIWSPEFLKELRVGSVYNEIY